MATLRGYLSEPLRQIGLTHPEARMIALGLVEITCRGLNGGGREEVTLELVIPAGSIEADEHRQWGNSEVRRVTLLNVNHDPFHTEGRNLAEVLKAVDRAMNPSRFCPHDGELYADHEYGTVFCRKCHAELPEDHPRRAGVAPVAVDLEALRARFRSS